MRTVRLTLVSGLAMVALTAFGAGPVQGQIVNPDNPHGVLPAGLDCRACHTVEAWSRLRTPIEFDHDGTGFPLDGRHGDASCVGCHLDLRFDGPDIGSTECSSCHLDVHQGTLTGGCASCHNTTSFQEAAALDQHIRTRFPLDGAHIRISCVQCHGEDTGGVFAPVDMECLACHQTDFVLGHDDFGAGTIDTPCELCHQTSSWSRSTFDHAAVANGFVLEGLHQIVPCEGCHVDGELRFPTTDGADCASCHEVDYVREHDGTGYPSSCVDCHTVDGWERGPFDHAFESDGYELEGIHRIVPCTACHLADHTPRYQPADNQDCIACHQQDYDQHHSADEYPIRCLTCHEGDSWARGPFDHAAEANGYVLEGGHRQAPCTSCHLPPDYVLRFQWSGPDDCVACHRAEYDAEHAGSGYPTTCVTCHSVSDWDHAVFDHLALSGFPLTEAHALAACSACHNAVDTSLLFPKPAGPDDCVACHRADYDQVHTGTGFPLTCASCHNRSQWFGAGFDHAGTGFGLEGAHAAATCTTCHNPTDNSLLFPTPTNDQDCVACHQAEYDAGHSGSGYPTMCADCHGTNQWPGATFNHAATGFTLLGAHTTAPCTSCHNPVDNSLLFPTPASDQDCYSCHQSDYNTGHPAGRYPRQCTYCHVLTTWSGASFDHGGYFPITSGSHAGKWQDCQQCHPALSDFAVFTCMSSGCHAQSDMDNDHSGVSGYVFDAVQCLACHPTGN